MGNVKIVVLPSLLEQGSGLTSTISYQNPDFMAAMRLAFHCKPHERIDQLEFHKDYISARFTTEPTTYSPKEYRKLMLNEPPAVDPLMEYGLRYHRECEEYDQKVCSHINERGIAMPVGAEIAEVTRNATNVRNKLRYELVTAGLARPEDSYSKIQEAIKMASRPFEKEWERKRDRSGR